MRGSGRQGLAGERRGRVPVLRGPPSSPKAAPVQEAKATALWVPPRGSSAEEGRPLPGMLGRGPAPLGRGGDPLLASDPQGSRENPKLLPQEAGERGVLPRRRAQETSLAAAPKAGERGAFGSGPGAGRRQ